MFQSNYFCFCFHSSNMIIIITVRTQSPNNCGNKLTRFLKSIKFVSWKHILRDFEETLVASVVLRSQISSQKIAVLQKFNNFFLRNVWELCLRLAEDHFNLRTCYFLVSYFLEVEMITVSVILQRKCFKNTFHFFKFHYMAYMMLLN